MAKLVPSAQYERFRSLLVSARESRGLKQSELGTELGQPQSFVSKYERGERRLDFLEFLAVAEALKMDPMKVMLELAKPGD
jgi:transcriptional regulator with XRE-family HTH domain